MLHFSLLNRAILDSRSWKTTHRRDSEKSRSVGSRLDPHLPRCSKSLQQFNYCSESLLPKILSTCALLLSLPLFFHPFMPSSYATSENGQRRDRPTTQNPLYITERQTGHSPLKESHIPQANDTEVLTRSFKSEMYRHPSFASRI